MNHFNAKRSWPSRRVILLALGVGILAFVDGQYLATHLFLAPIWRLLIRPALFFGAILGFAALYSAGAEPPGPWGRARRSTGFRVALLFAVVLGLGKEFLDLLEPFLPKSVTNTWSDSNGNLQSVTYPDVGNLVEALVLAAALIVNLAVVALVVLAIFAPAIAMRSGWSELIGESWRAIRRHWLAIGLRGVAIFPIAIIGLPIMSYWRVDAWTLGNDSNPEQVSRIGFAIQMCERVGVDGIAYSAFASATLFGLFLWWLGRSTAVLLDGPE